MNEQQDDVRERTAAAITAVNAALNPVNGASPIAFLLLTSHEGRASLASNITDPRAVLTLLLDTIAHYQRHPPGNA